MASLAAGEVECVEVSRSFYGCFYAYSRASKHIHWFARSLLAMTSHIPMDPTHMNQDDSCRSLLHLLRI